MITVGMPVCNAMPWLPEAVERLLRQTDLHSIFGQLRGPEIELEEAEANDVLGRRNWHSAPPVAMRTEFSRRLRRVYYVSPFRLDGDNIA